MRPLARALLAGIALGAVTSTATGTRATEAGTSLYIPGLSVPMAGFVPPPGVFFDSTTYFYECKLAGGRTTRIGGNIVSDVKANIWADFATGLWVTPVQIFGGNLAFAVTVPV